MLDPTGRVLGGRADDVLPDEDREVFAEALFDLGCFRKLERRLIPRFRTAIYIRAIFQQESYDTRPTAAPIAPPSGNAE